MSNSRSHRPAIRAAFLRRLLRSVLLASALLVVSLGIGIAGYMYFEHLPWVDAFLNSAMLLGGMGPVDAPKSNAGKLFAGLYALYAGVGFLLTAALLFTPVLHRVLLEFHWSEKI